MIPEMMSYIKSPNQPSENAGDRTKNRKSKQWEPEVIYKLIGEIAGKQGNQIVKAHLSPNLQ